MKHPCGSSAIPSNQPIISKPALFFLLLLVFLFQLYLAVIRVDLPADLYASADVASYVEWNQTKAATHPYQATVPQQRHARRRNKDQSFGACLMVKNDNDMLYEWIAYHYTTLPLGRIVIGRDIGGEQDPSDVLHRWKRAGIDDLQYWILDSEDFIHRHSRYKYGEGGNRTGKELKAYNHHTLIHRQKGFLTVCNELLKKNGAHWVVHIDSDEFVALNPATSYESDDAASMSNGTLAIRKRIANDIENMTVLDLVQDLQRDGVMSECYIMPRLLVGALENRTCPKLYETTRIQQLAQARLNDRYQQMSTLRFTQHARKGDFMASKFGKAMLDVSKLSNETIQQFPRSPHRPYPSHCGNAVGVPFPDTFFFLMHYIGSWERYSHRGDLRRTRSEWEERAFVDYVTNATVGSSGCASRVHLWYPRFLDLVGEEVHTVLLGGN
jgi:Glycosyl transferase family 2